MTTKIYMQFGDIKGLASDPTHKGWIELVSCNYSANRSVTQTSGSSNRSVGTASLSSITITKEMNIASQRMFTEAHAGSGTDMCVIHFVSAKGTYLEYKLSNAILVNYHVTHHTEANKPSEIFSINFTRIDTRYTPSAEEGGSPSSAGYDIPTAKNL